MWTMTDPRVDGCSRKTLGRPRNAESEWVYSAHYIYIYKLPTTIYIYYPDRDKWSGLATVVKTKGTRRRRKYIYVPLCPASDMVRPPAKSYRKTYIRQLCERVKYIRAYCVQR